MAGPVCVGAVGMMMNVRPATSDLPRWTRWTSELLKGVKDSKKLSAKKREEWFKILQESPEFECHHVFVSHEAIDKFGIRKAVIFGVEKVLEKFSRKPDLGVDGRFSFCAQGIQTGKLLLKAMKKSRLSPPVLSSPKFPETE